MERSSRRRRLLLVFCACAMSAGYACSRSPAPMFEDHELEAGEVVALELRVPDVLPCALDVGSGDFDVLAALGEHAPLADADAGVGFDEELELPAPAPKQVWLRVGARDGRGGAFRVRWLAADERPKPRQRFEQDVATLTRLLAASPSESDRAKARACLYALALDADQRGVPTAAAAIFQSIAQGAGAGDPWAENAKARLACYGLGSRTPEPALSECNRLLEAASDLRPEVVLRMQKDCALFAARQGAWDVAMERFKQMLAYAEAHSDAGHCALALVLLSNCSTLPAEQASAARNRALELLGQDSIVDATAAVQAAVQLGRAMRQEDRLAEARRLYERFVDRKEIGTRWRAELESLLFDLDLLDMRNLDAARRVDELTRLLADYDLGRHAPYYELDVAKGLFRLGKREEAERRIDALRAQPAVLASRRLTIDCLRQEALHRETQWDFEGARAKYSEALQGDFSTPELIEDKANLLMQRGRAARLSGDMVGAEADYRAALAAADKRFPLIVAGTQDGLAQLCLALGRIQEARDWIQPAIMLYRSRNVGEYMLDSTLQTVARIALAERDRAGARAALREAQNWLDSAQQRLIAPEDAASIRSRYAGWGEIAQDLSALDADLAQDDAARLAAIREGFAWAGEWKAGALFALMSRQEPRCAAPDVLARLLERSRSRRVLVEYASGHDCVYAYVLHGGELTRYVLGARGDIEAAARAYVEGLFRTVGPLSRAETVRAGSALYGMLLAVPLARIPAETDALEVIPSAGLADLPFDALVIESRDSAGGPLQSFDTTEFVLDRFVVTYAPSAPVLARLSTRLSSGSPRKRLLVGDPVVPAGSGLAALDQARDEVLDAALSSVPAARLDQLGNRANALRRRTDAEDRWHTDWFDLFLGKSANRDEALAGDLRQYGILHFAVHGRVDADDPARTGLLLSPDARAEILLSLRQIQALDIDADLAILSACQTAHGHVLAGEGVQSIAAAFLGAGARGVVATLWDIEDPDAVALVKTFDDRLVARDGAGTALAMAKRKVRARGGSRSGIAFDQPSSIPLLQGHPSKWARWIYLGCETP